MNFSISEYKKKYPVSDMAVFDLAEEPDDWTEARDFLNQPSMFVDSKVAVLKNSGEVSERGWLKVLKSNLESPRTFIFISDGKKPLKAFEFLLESPVKSQFFGELDGRLLETFVKKEAAARGLILEKKAEDFFLGYLSALNERSWIAISELDKFALLGLAQPIKFEDIRKVIASASNDEVFDVAKQIMWSRNWTEKLKLLERLLLQKKEPAYIFNSLAFSARGRELIRLADYDAAIKGGNLDYEEALTDFVLTF